MENTINKILKKKTVIMAAHCAEFLNRADKIIFMKKGKIDFCGNYEAFSKTNYFH